MLAYASSVTIAFAAGPAGSPNPIRPSIPIGPMNEVITGKVLVKVRGLSGVPSEQNPFLAQLKLQPSLSLATSNRISSKLGGATLQRILPFGGWTLWKVDPSRSLSGLLNSVRSDASVVTATPVNRIYALGVPMPGDPDLQVEETGEPMVLDVLGEGGISFMRMWHLADTNALTWSGTTVTGGGWNTFPGKWYTAANKNRNAPLIAIIDTGCDMDHPDFANQGSTNTDSASGGQLVKSLSRQFLDGDVLDPSIGDPTDTNGHGTHVAGLAVASGNNTSNFLGGHSTIGTGYNSRAMILRVFDEYGVGSDMDAANAIFYAVDHGADIINLSLGTTNYSQIFQDAVTYAWQSGALVIAAGNENGSGGGNLGPIYPAACSGALAVSANGPDYVPANDNYAGYGYYVDIAAPGGNLVTSGDIFGSLSYKMQYIYSTATRYDCTLSQADLTPPYTLNYTYLIGTSMATPQVSGAAGLYYEKFGISKSTPGANYRAYQALQRTALGTSGMPNGGWEETQGYGSLDVGQLLTDTTALRAAGGTAPKVGSIKGIVYYGGTPIPLARVTAQVPGSTKVYQTTCHLDGTYRFDGLKPDTYYITASPFAYKKSKLAKIVVGCDTAGLDFFCGPKIGDTSSPTVKLFSIDSFSGNAISVKYWGSDTETELDSATVQIGSTSGAKNALAATPLPIGQTAGSASGAVMAAGSRYYATLVLTNGDGLTSQMTLPFDVPLSADNASFVTQNIPSSMKAGQTYTVNATFKNTGTTIWAASTGVKLGTASVASVWGSNRWSLNMIEKIQPGASKTFSFNVKAPATPGMYPLQVQMIRDGVQWFGTAGTLVNVNVTP